MRFHAFFCGQKAAQNLAIVPTEASALTTHLPRTDLGTDYVAPRTARSHLALQLGKLRGAGCNAIARAPMAQNVRLAGV